MISPVTSFALKFFISDDNNNYIDFSDRCSESGKNTLMRVAGSISYSFERSIGAFFMKTSAVELDNKDGLFDQPLPGSLVATRDSDWQAINTAASFTDTSGELESCLYYHKCAILVESALKDAFSYFGRRPILGLTPLIVCYIIGLSSDWQKRTVTLKMGSLAKPLQEKDAGKVRKGLSWYQNRPVKFLVEELLKQQYIESNGEVPTDFSLEDIMEIPVAGGAYRVSAFGRPPEKMNTGEWKDEGFICRALASRTIVDTTLLQPAVVEDTDIEVTSVTDISIGDYLIVGPNSSDEQEKVKVTKITGVELTLEKPLAYSYAAGNSVRRTVLYLGCDEHLYQYDPDKDEYTDLGSTANYIRRLWWNTNDDKLWMVAWADVDDAIYVDMKIYSWDSVNGLVLQKSGSELQYTFTGEFCSRVGASSFVGWGRTIGANIGGENIPLLYSAGFWNADQPLGNDFEIQYIMDESTLFVSDAAETANLPASPNQFEALPKYVAASAENYIAPPTNRNLHLKFSFGQDGCVLFDSTLGTKGSILFFYWTHPAVAGDPGYYQLIRYDINGDALSAFTNWPNNFEIDAHYVAPTCGCVHGGYLYVGLVYWNEAAAGDSDTYLVRFKLDDSGAPTVLYRASSDTDNEYYYLFLEMLHTGSELIVNFFSRDKVGESDCFKIGSHSDSAAVHAIGNTLSNRYRYKGMVKASIEVGEDDHLYMLEEGSAKIKRYNASTYSFDTGVDSFPIVAEETNLAAGLVADEVRDLLWMVSAAAYPKEMYIDAPQGKYYLVKHNDYLTGRVELGEFEGMKVWDALSHLAEVVNCVMGFYPDGNFFFKTRPDRGATAYQYTTVGEGNITSLTKDRNYEEVYNYSRRVPYVAKILDPSVKIITLPNSEFNQKETNDAGDAMKQTEFFVNQADTAKKSIDLVCIKGGLISNGAVEFKVHSIYGRSEFRVVSAASGNDWLYLNDLEDIRILDSLEISDEAGGVNEETATVGKSMTTLSQDMTEAAKKAYVGSTANFNQGDVILVADDATDWANKEYMVVTGWTGAYLTVERGYLGTTAIIHSSGAVVYKLSSSQNKLWLNAVLTNTYTANDLVVATKYGEDEWLTDSAQIFTPVDDEWVEIGSGLYRTYVSLKFTVPTDVAEETKLMEGDKIEIVCPGMKLEAVAQSVQTDVNLSSIAKFGRREYPVRDNKFLNYRLAENAVSRDLELFAQPRYEVNVEGKFLPRLYPLDAVIVIEPGTFIRSKVQSYLGVSGYIAPSAFHAVKGYVKSLTHNPDKGKTKATIRVFAAF